MMHEPGDTAILPRFTDEQLEQLYPYGTERSFEEGEYLFTEKESVDSFYVVLEGRVRISLSSEGDTIAMHPAGEFTGGLAILTGKGSRHRAQATLPSRIPEITARASPRLPRARLD